MTTVKYESLIKTFEQGDISEWLKKLELVARLQKIQDICSFLPLFLSGGAFKVYDGLSEETKHDFGMLKKALTKAFAKDRYRTYEDLTHRKLEKNETPDVYLADIRHMLQLIGDTESPNLLKCCVVAGLPESIKVQIKGSCNLDHMTIEGLMEKIRSLVNELKENDHYGVFVGRSTEVTCLRCGNRGHTEFQCSLNRPGSSTDRSQIKCYNCNEFGHTKYQCPLNRRGNTNASAKSQIRCYNCNELGHYKNHCTKFQKNGEEAQ